jgi:septal ring factor EnvC (AmiA/AmiB activator)
LTATQMKLYEMQKSIDTSRRSLQNLRTQITALQESLKKTPNIPADTNAAVKKVADQVSDLQRRLSGTPDTSGNAGPPLPDEPRPLAGRVGQMAGGLDSYTAAPTADELRRIEEAAGELRAFIEQLNKVIDESIPNLNKQMRDSGMTFVNAGQRVPPPQ